MLWPVPGCRSGAKSGPRTPAPRSSSEPNSGPGPRAVASSHSPRHTPFASFIDRRHVKAFARNRRLARNKPLLRMPQRYGAVEYQSGVDAAYRNRQRGLQRVKELLHVAGAEAPADPKPRDLRIADDDAG